MSADFAENKYPAAPRHTKEYKRLVARGYTEMKIHSTVICGTARNVLNTLPTTIARVEKLGSLFGDYVVVVFENDSTDGTVEGLQAWAAANQKVNVLTESRNDPVNPGTRCLARADRMALYRNKYHDYIVSNLTMYEYVLVVDMDLPEGWSYDGIANTFGHRNWDFVGSNGMLIVQPPNKPVRIAHFDAWAFRHINHPEPHKPQEINPLQFGRGQPMLPVLSCFGGVGVYRTPAFISSRYAGGDCEHVPFHLGMRNAGFNKTYMNPSQIVSYGVRNH